MSSLSASSMKNVKNATKVLKVYAAVKNMPDPKEVTTKHSALISNVLSDHCAFGTEKSLGFETMNGLIQGLRHLYNINGHTSPWYRNLASQTARGNPLIQNPELETLKRAHKVHLARLGVVKIRRAPITVSLIADHAAQFWIGANDSDDIRDVLLHSILLVGINLGLRYDEVMKLRVEHLSTNSDGVTFTLNESIKNSPTQLIYHIAEWEGNRVIRQSIFLDPFIALYSWLEIRGGDDGPIFSDIKLNMTGMTINTSVPWSVSNFTSFLRKRLFQIGVGSSDVDMYTGHSIKRGNVQLYRSLGYRDDYIMQKIQMTGFKAYANYCEAYNDCNPASMPNFNTITAFLEHAEIVQREISSPFDNLSQCLLEEEFEIVQQRCDREESDFDLAEELTIEITGIQTVKIILSVCAI